MSHTKFHNPIFTPNWPQNSQLPLFFHVPRPYVRMV
jgi:hypothetical protein